MNSNQCSNQNMKSCIYRKQFSPAKMHKIDSYFYSLNSIISYIIVIMHRQAHGGVSLMKLSVADKQPCSLC